MEARDIVIRVSGEAGDGIVTAGELLTQAATRAGLHTQTFEIYGAEVKGGESIYQVRISAKPVLEPGEKLDLLLALERKYYIPHLKNLKRGGILIHDSNPVESTVTPELEENDFLPYPVPMSEVVRRIGARPQSRNMVALGVMGRIMELPLSLLEQVVQRKFGRRGEAILNTNLEALRAGFEYATVSIPERLILRLSKDGAEERVLMSGNQAIALGAIAAGCKVYAGYPISPATDIMEFLAAELPKYGGAVVQTEDEMAALGVVLGASYAGQRAMTATSGPGLSLMVELINLASMAEIPAVIVDAQRAGPSTGMPTRPEQADLNLVLFGSHGESPRIVLAPTTVEGCFYVMLKAFDLADKYQMPVFVLSDFFLSKRKESFPKPDLGHLTERYSRIRPSPAELEEYRRYRFTETGVSPITSPGESGGAYVATGLEHDEEGTPNYEPEMHQRMMQKRFRKLEAAARELQDVRLFGPRDAEMGVIGWGSTEGVSREALLLAQERGIRAAALYPLALSPLPVHIIKEFAVHKKGIVVPELNYTGQFASLLRSRCGIEPVQVDISQGRLLTAREILEAIEEVARNGASKPSRIQEQEQAHLVSRVR